MIIFSSPYSYSFPFFARTVLLQTKIHSQSIPMQAQVVSVIDYIFRTGYLRHATARIESAFCFLDHLIPWGWIWGSGTVFLPLTKTDDAIRPLTIHCTGFLTFSNVPDLIFFNFSEIMFRPASCELCSMSTHRPAECSRGIQENPIILSAPSGLIFYRGVEAETVCVGYR